MKTSIHFQREVELGLWITYVWRANVLSRASDSTCLDATCRIDPNIPSMFDIILNLEDARLLASEAFRALGVDANYIGAQHLDVAVPTETS